MKRILRMIPAAALLAAGLGAPGLAQDADAPATSISIPAPATNSADTVGPAQLRNFSLQGTVTRQAEKPQAAAAQAQRAATTAPAPSRTAAQAPASAAPQRAVPQAGPAQRQAAASPSTPSSVASSGTFNFPPPTPAREPATRFTPAVVSPEPSTSPAAMPIDPATSDGDNHPLAYWPWLLALLVAAGAAIWYFRRPRESYAFAGAGAETGFERSPPPAPPVPTPRPQPAPAPPAPRAMPPQPAPRAPALVQPAVVGGVVSTRLKAAPEIQPAPSPPTLAPVTPGLVSSRLRPWLELEFTPLSAVVSGDKAVIEFQLRLFNSGSAPARDVLIEARLFNAGDDQDEAIADFFSNRVAEGNAVPLVGPLQRMEFRTSASVSRNQMRIFEAGGRQVFVPLIGFNAIYRWSSGQGQTSVSYILGRDKNGEKMAPFIVGDVEKTFRDLGAREHTLRIRK